MPGKKTIRIFSLIGIASFLLLIVFAVYSHYYEKEQGLFERPSVSKEEAINIAKAFVRSLGTDVRYYPQKSIGYSSRNDETLYLLKKFDYGKTRELIYKDKIPYAYWDINWSGVKGENISVSIDSQNKKVIDYEFYRFPSPQEKIINLRESEAKELAEKFIVSQGFNLADFGLANVNKNTNTIQDEYYFKWQKVNYKLAEAVFIINLAVKADKIASYHFGLQLPDDYQYTYENNQFVSNFWIMLSGGFSVILGVILIVLAIIKRGILDWRMARLWALALGGVFLLDFLNGQSNYVFYIDIIYKVISAASFSLVALILVPVSSQLFKENFHKDIFLKRQDKNSLYASVIICYALTFFSFLIVSGVYDLLDRFKITWDVGAGMVFDKIFTSKMVYLSPFLVGIIPAFMEEFFRGFTIAFLKKIFKNTLACVLISAFLWGFGHTATDGSFYPGYIIGIEKFLNGIMVGYILLYFGIEVAIFWHFLNNFFATSIFMLYLGPKFAIYSGFLSVIMLLPFFFSMHRYFRSPAAVSAQV